MATFDGQRGGMSGLWPPMPYYGLKQRIAKEAA